jgi:hypothetical protein
VASGVVSAGDKELRKQLEGACCMNIPANVLNVFIRESIQVLAL